jgi:hypothetical protein
MPELCPECGRVAFVDIDELMPDTREISIISCCEANREGWLEEMRTWTHKMWAEWLRRKSAYEFRRIAIGEDNWLLDYGLEVREIEWQEAKAYVAEYHQHNKPPNTWRFGAGIYNGPDRIGVVIVGNPNSRHLYKQGCMGIDRVCINRDIPSGLVWNACSMAYGWACREIARRLPGFNRVVTYTLLDEPGTSLIAAGFKRVSKTKGGSWNRTNRPREDKATTEPKWRWERVITVPKTGRRIQIPGAAGSHFPAPGAYPQLILFEMS